MLAMRDIAQTGLWIMFSALKIQLPSYICGYCAYNLVLYYIEVDIKQKL